MQAEALQLDQNHNVMSAMETGALHDETLEYNDVGWGDPADVDTTFENQRLL